MIRPSIEEQFARFRQRTLHGTELRNFSLPGNTKKKNYKYKVQLNVYIYLISTESVLQVRAPHIIL